MAQEKIKKAKLPIKNKHTDDLIDHYWGTLGYIVDMIRASEIKAGLILSFYGIILNLIFQSLSTVTSYIGNDIIFFMIAGMWVICTIISIFYSIKCFMPRIEASYEKNVFFFGDVIRAFGDIKSFSKTFYEISVDEDKIFDQLGQQIYINSKIANEKFKNVNSSLKFLALSLLVFIILTIYYFIALKIS